MYFCQGWQVTKRAAVKSTTLVVAGALYFLGVAMFLAGVFGEGETLDAQALAMTASSPSTVDARAAERTIGPELAVRGDFPPPQSGPFVGQNTATGLLIPTKPPLVAEMIAPTISK